MDVRNSCPSSCTLLSADSNCHIFYVGRNLSDKKFHYLRIIIVTAAIYRDFVRRLHCHKATIFLDLPALGMHQPLRHFSAGAPPSPQEEQIHVRENERFFSIAGPVHYINS